MEQPGPAGPLVVSSVIGRQQYLRLIRQIMRALPRSRRSRVTRTLLFHCGLFLIFFFSWRRLGTGTALVAAVVVTAAFLACRAGSRAWLKWRVFRRMWVDREKSLTAPGTMTLDEAGLHHVVPGAFAVSHPWSAVEGVVDGGDMIAVGFSSYSWTMIALPPDAGIAARVRGFIATHVPTR
jgi:hypothetical protein